MYRLKYLGLAALLAFGSASIVVQPAQATATTRIVVEVPLPIAADFNLSDPASA
jgi:hypothetical protein